MSLYSGPEEHAANPPKTWEVRKATDRRWHLVDRQGSVLESATTKREAEALKDDGFCARLWEQERRWYAGSEIPGWKSWEQVKAERERREAWLAERSAAR